MKNSSLRAYLLAAACAASVVFTWGRPFLRAQGGPDDLQKRMTAVEAGQAAILKELQEIKALLVARPPLPTPAAGPVNPPPNPTAPPNFDLDVMGAPMKGRADAKLVVLEFSDFQCPFCGRYARETLPQIERDYVDTGKVKYFFRHFPIERLHPLALRAAEAADCARTQGKFWEMNTRLFANQQALAESDLTKTAQAVGLNMGAFTQCLASQLTSPTKIRQDQTEGSRAGITGTPTFFLGTMTKEGKLHPLRRLVGAQPYASFKTVIDNLLASPQFAK